MSESLPTLNLSIGPSCPVRCEGCYNLFGETSVNGGLVSAEGVNDFMLKAVELGVGQATVAGGDPLTHPEIKTILTQLKENELRVQLDTVGASIISSPQILYKGQGVSQRVSAEDLAECGVDLVSLPLDGADNETANKFRKGRSDLLEITEKAAKELREVEINVGVNTVVNSENIDQLVAMREIVKSCGAFLWQLFEFDPSGPNPSRKKSTLVLGRGDFRYATSRIEPLPEVVIDPKSNEMRQNAYFIVNDAGIAWRPRGEGVPPELIGHIVRDQVEVLRALEDHLRAA